VVKVRVKDVDVARKRIALTMKSGAIDRPAGGPRPSSAPAAAPRAAVARPSQASQQQPAESALAAALRRAQERK
jgi:uncharacterized protein